MDQVNSAIDVGVEPKVRHLSNVEIHFGLLLVDEIKAFLSRPVIVITGLDMKRYLVEWIFQKLKYICSADFLIQAVFYNKNKFWTMKRPLAFMTEAR